MRPTLSTNNKVTGGFNLTTTGATDTEFQEGLPSTLRIRSEETFTTTAVPVGVLIDATRSGIFGFSQLTIGDQNTLDAKVAELANENATLNPGGGPGADYIRFTTDISTLNSTRSSADLVYIVDTDALYQVNAVSTTDVQLRDFGGGTPSFGADTAVTAIYLTTRVQMALGTNLGADSSLKIYGGYNPSGNVFTIDAFNQAGDSNIAEWKSKVAGFDSALAQFVDEGGMGAGGSVIEVNASSGSGIGLKSQWGSTYSAQDYDVTGVTAVASNPTFYYYSDAIQVNKPFSSWVLDNVSSTQDVSNFTQDGTGACVKAVKNNSGNAIQVDASGVNSANDVYGAEIVVANAGGGNAIALRTNGGAIADVPDEITATSEGVAASVKTMNTEVTTNGDSDLDNVTLANGISGQIKHIYCVAVGNAADSFKITPANMVGGSQITFAASPLGLGCTLVYADNEGWVVVANNGGTIS